MEHNNILLSVAVMHTEKTNLSKWIASLPKGIQIVSCVTVQKDKFEDEIEIIANTKNIVTFRYYYKSYDDDFDFSKVRNYMDEYASGRWILHMDADEYIGMPHDELISIVEDIDKTDAVGAWLTICGIMHKQDTATDLRERYSIAALRLVKKCEYMQWEGICHEWVDTIDDDNNKVYDSDIILIHDGYKLDDNGFMDKGERNAKLLIREYTRKPTNRVWNYLIKTFGILKLKE